MVGAMAPRFRLLDADDRPVVLEDLIGRAALLVLTRHVH
jgi:peroxiredoxin